MTDEAMKVWREAWQAADYNSTFGCDDQAAAAVIAADRAGLVAENARLREVLGAIQQAVVDGRVCDDVAWFSTIETLYDFIEEVLHPSPPAAVGDLFAALKDTRHDADAILEKNNG